MAERPYQSETRGVIVGTHELAALRKRFEAVADQLTNDRGLADAIGDQQANSARRRISETKRSPDGKRWQSWSREYAKTRTGKHSLLVSTGKLRDSITHHVRSNTEVEVGSNLVYARVHLRGSAPGAKPKIPARPYLDTEPGFADPRDRAELREVLREFWVEKGIKRSRSGR